MSASRTVLIIAGPTASGKSALATRLAQQHDGVVINADSMQIYREIPVISAQPSRAEQQLAPHRLYGFHPITKTYSAADWAMAALNAINDTHADNRIPFLVGGSGLYLRALIEGFSPMPNVPASIRKQCSDLYDVLGPHGFHSVLEKIDPVSAARLHPTDRQRCIRAREVFEATNEPLSAWQQKPKQNLAPDLRFVSLVLLPDRAWLHDRINRRFEQMVEQGALQEAQQIHNMNLDPMLTGAKAVGLQALRDHIDQRLTLREAIEHGQTASRQYAKRQYTWFRNQPLPNAHVIEKPDMDVDLKALLQE